MDGTVLDGGQLTADWRGDWNDDKLLQSFESRLQGGRLDDEWLVRVDGLVARRNRLLGRTKSRGGFR